MQADKEKSDALNPSEPTNRSLVPRLLGLAWVYRRRCFKLVLLQLAAAGLLLAGLAFTGLAIDVVRYHADSSTLPPAFPFGIAPPRSWTPVSVVAMLAGIVLLCALGRAALAYWFALGKARLVHEEIIVDLRRKIYDKLQRMSFRFFDKTGSGSSINRVTTDVAMVRQFVDGVLLQVVMLVLSLGFYLIYMFSIHVTLTLVTLATTPLLWLASAIFSRSVRPAYDKNRELFDNLVLVLSENVQGVRVVKGFARQQEQIDRFAESNKALEDQQNWIFTRVSIYAPAVGLLTQINLVLLLGYGGYLVMQNELALGSGLIVFAGLLQQFAAQVSTVADIANSVQQSFSGARRVFEILDAPYEVESAADAVPLPHVEGRVAFEGVGFEYHPGEPVLADIRFEVRPGQCVAILGVTGSGKSTLLSLIPRFYDCTTGRLLVDGHDVRDLDLADLRRSIGLVFQESFLFSTTVAENIAFGQPDASPEQVEQAARTAAAHEFIMELPHGYDTILGEAGLDLSGGQRQRLAIARALLLEPAILLMDDPTAAVDSETEHEILEAMQNATRGRTTFVVAHRLSTLRKADLVMVLDAGRIVQMGSHAELYAASGHYREAALLQTQWTADTGEVAH